MLDIWTFHSMYLWLLNELEKIVLKHKTRDIYINDKNLCGCIYFFLILFFCAKNFFFEDMIV